jgi:tetratricopeptide (TPR) repeat protein
MNCLSKLKFVKRSVVFLLLFWAHTVPAQPSTVEAEIHNAFRIDRTQKSLVELKKITQSLESAMDRIDSNSNRYWLSYSLYNQALVANYLDQKELAEALIDRAIELLKPVKNEAESLALLSLELGYSIQFKNYWAMMNLGSEALLIAERAVELAPNNLRTNLALALNDFYTPKLFGGGKKVEYHLKKAIDTTGVTQTNSSPSWGKENVYELLVRHYRKNKQEEIALTYLDKGLVEFPNSGLLLGLKK